MVWKVYSKIEELSGAEKNPVTLGAVEEAINIRRDLLVEYVRSFQLLDKLDYNENTATMRLR